MNKQTSKKTKPTMATIAKKLGYSTMTVSKCFKNSSDISSNTCQKVFKTAQSLGYVYERVVATKVAVLVKDVFVSKGDTFYNELYQRLHERSLSAHLQLVMIMVKSSEEKDFLKRFFYPELDGVLLMGQFSNDFVVELKSMMKIPLICLDFYTYPLVTDAIISNNFMASFEITSHLISLGHQQIAFLGNLNATSSINDRFFGYQKALLENHLQTSVSVIDDRKDNTIYQEFTLPQKMPSAFVCNNDHAAYLLIKQLQKQGYKIPEDISVTGFDDVVYSGTSDPQITTVRVSRNYMADSAISTLLKKIKTKDDVKRLISLDCYIVKRHSTAKPIQ
jgi:LacI family transcriptional regulator